MWFFFIGFFSPIWPQYNPSGKITKFWDVPDLGPYLSIWGQKGIPQNLSPQVLGEVRVNFLGWIPPKTFHFVSRRSESLRKFLGRLRMILCYWKTFSVRLSLCSFFFFFQQKPPLHAVSAQRPSCKFPTAALCQVCRGIDGRVDYLGRSPLFFRGLTLQSLLSLGPPSSWLWLWLWHCHCNSHTIRDENIT